MFVRPAYLFDPIRVITYYTHRGCSHPKTRAARKHCRLTTNKFLDTDMSFFTGPGFPPHGLG